MGDAVCVTRVWSIHTKTQRVCRWQPITSLPVWPQLKRAPGEYVLFFVFSDCIVWSVHSMGKNNFLPLLWWALARRLTDMWIRVLVIWHLMTHTIFASFVWATRTHAMSSRRQSACTVSIFPWESIFLSVSLFEEGGEAVSFPQFRTRCCRGTEENELVGLADGSGLWVREGVFLFALISRERGWAAGLWWCDLFDIIWSSG